MKKTSAIAVRHVSKKYKDVVALDDVTFDVASGEVVALLGPNGAGKTTLLEIVEGIRPATGGYATICKEDVRNLSSETGAKVGVQLQNVRSYQAIAVREFLDLMVIAYGGRTATDSLLRLVGLTRKSKAMLSSLSAGQYQRVSFAAALAGDPDVLILDEPTSNLDPQSRRLVWNEIRKRSAAGTAVLFATHQLDEAEEFCDRVAIIDRGRIVALGSPSELIRTHCPGYDLALRMPAAYVSTCRHVLGEDASIGDDDVHATVTWRANRLEDAIGTVADLSRCNAPLLDIQLKQHSLEDVFIHLTGESLRE